MKKVFLFISLICIIIINYSNLSAKENDIIWNQYENTIRDLYLKITLSCNKLEYENSLININYDTAKKLDHPSIRLSNEIKEHENNILKIKENIRSYKMEIAKTKNDLLKYYKGNPPKKSYRDLLKYESEQLNDLNKCIPVD